MNLSVNDGSLLTRNSTDDSQHHGGSSSVVGDFSLHEAPKMGEKSLKENSANIFRINILSTFNKMVSLPSLDVWNRLVLPIVAAQGRLNIQIRSSGFLLRHDSGWITSHCVLSTKGYFVIYAKEMQNKGYAVNLSRAKKLSIMCERIEDKDYKTKNYCTIVIKWKFGSLFMNLNEDQVEHWRDSIIKSFETNDEAESSNSDNVIEQNIESESISKRNDNAVDKTDEVETAAPIIPLMDDDTLSIIESSQTERSSTNQHDSSENHNLSQCPTEECKSPIDGREPNELAVEKINVTKHEDVDENKNDNGIEAWSSIDYGKNVVPSKVISDNIYASLPVSFVRRHRSEGMVRFAPCNSFYNVRYNRTPLLEWLNDVGADERFRRAKQYFEMGVVEEELDAENN